jgi:hypothetical protein
MRKPKMLSFDALIELLLGLAISLLLFWLLWGCSTLQKEPGFKNYSKNQIWRTEK